MITILWIDLMKKNLAIKYSLKLKMAESDLEIIPGYYASHSPYLYRKEGEIPTKFCGNSRNQTLG